MSHDEMFNEMPGCGIEMLEGNFNRDCERRHEGLYVIVKLLTYLCLSLSFQ